MKVLGAFLVLACSSLYAQNSLVVKDAKGNVIGIPVFLQAEDRNIDVITPQGNLLSLSQWDGHLEYYLVYLVFESTDCTGTGYADHHFRSASPKFIEINTGPSASGIALLPATPQVQELEIRSNNYSAPCSQYQAPTMRTVVNVTDYIVDPTSYGFEWSLDQGRWVIQVPFSVEIVEADAIFCSGFEGCPTD